VVVVAGGEANKAERVVGEAVVSIQGQRRGSHFLLSLTSTVESSMAKLHLLDWLSKYKQQAVYQIP